MPTLEDLIHAASGNPVRVLQLINDEVDPLAQLKDDVAESLKTRVLPSTECGLEHCKQEELINNLRIHRLLLTIPRRTRSWVIANALSARLRALATIAEGVQAIKISDTDAAEAIDASLDEALSIGRVLRRSVAIARQLLAMECPQLEKTGIDRMQLARDVTSMELDIFNGELLKKISFAAKLATDCVTPLEIVLAKRTRRRQADTVVLVHKSTEVFGELCLSGLQIRCRNNRAKTKFLRLDRRLMRLLLAGWLTSWRAWRETAEGQQAEDKNIPIWVYLDLSRLHKVVRRGASRTNLSALRRSMVFADHYGLVSIGEQPAHTEIMIKIPDCSETKAPDFLAYVGQLVKKYKVVSAHYR